MEESSKVTHIKHVVSVGLHPPHALTLTCATATVGEEFVLGMEQLDIGPFVIALIRAAQLAEQHLGPAPNPAMFQMKDLEVTAETSTQQVALVLHCEGFRVPLLLPADKARAAAESLLRHAAMFQPPDAMN